VGTVRVSTNNFLIKRLPTRTFYHYDGALQSCPCDPVPLSDLPSPCSRDTQSVRSPPFLPVPTSSYRPYLVITPDVRNNPRRGLEIIDRLQLFAQPQLFNPRAAYDGQKNMYTYQELPSAEVPTSQSSLLLVCLFPRSQFEVQMSDRPREGSTSGIFKVRITKVAEIDPQYTLPLFTTTTAVPC